MTIAALLVTSNSQRWIAQTLHTITTQTRQPDAVIIIDDNSTDETRRIIHRVLGGTATVIRATSKADDITTRIAHNFHQGIRACAEHEVVVLGDHDDLWHPTRVERQAAQLMSDVQVQMVASDGRLIDIADRPMGGTLRDTFPVPTAWERLGSGAQTRYVVRHSIATGGASALKPQGFVNLTIPSHWLHDRWWSLVATVRAGMRLDPEALIDYRVSETQEVGLRRGRQGHSRPLRLVAAVAQAPDVIVRVNDLYRHLRPLATEPEARQALSWPALLRALS